MSEATNSATFSSPPLQHLAIIMDGNGRWAERQGLNRLKGHTQGTEVAEQVIRECAQLKVPYLTLFAFSTENWNRPTKEINFLFSLLDRYLNQRGQELIKQNIRLETIGDLSRLPKALQSRIQELKASSRHNTGMTLIFALNYGGRNEITQAALKMHKKIIAHELEVQNFSETNFAECLQTSLWPDPDLVIRTSGEKRISNFMIWQMAYSELHFSKKYWPDFTKEDLYAALLDYSQRHRRYGGLSGSLNESDTTSTEGSL